MTQIQISEDAFEDLKTGYLFHENRQAGLGGLAVQAFFIERQW
ncbi:hypothetical protein QQ056_13980 [Oscillatoria laete-virens NRMC-F 0139]|nr:hypothetical protein [Oscillatoria laete-virens]MDL5054646.1 hypothetical protein [Oscillatoria laete-virens NRMC-F 0139]